MKKILSLIGFVCSMVIILKLLGYDDVLAGAKSKIDKIAGENSLNEPVIELTTLVNWSSNRIAKDPKGFLEASIKELDNKISELQGTLINIENKRAGTQRIKDNTDADLENAKRFVALAKEKFKNFDGKYPLEINGLFYDEKQFKKAFIDASKRVNSKGAAAAQSNNEARAYEVQYAKLKTALDNAYEAREKMEQKLRATIALETDKDVQTLKDNIEQVIDQANAGVKDDVYIPTETTQGGQSEGEIINDEFDKLMSGE